MYTSDLENKLIFPDIADQMQQYVSIQQDIDDTKVKAASLIAQSIDIERVIGEDNLSRVVISEDNPTIEGEDLKLKQLLVAPLCYYTYSRLLISFHGSYTDSGYENDQLAAQRNEAKSVSKEMKGVAESFMVKVIDFLEKENPSEQIDSKKLTPRIRVFGGKETRSSN